MILVSGPSGNIGRLLLPELLKRGATVRAIVRNPAKAAESVAALEKAGVEVCAGDLAEPETLVRAMDGVDSAFLLTPVSEQMLGWKRNFIAAARTAGVRHVVNLSVTGAAQDSATILGRWHWQAERELEESGLDYTHLRPTDLARYATEMFLGTARSEGAIYSTVGDGRIAMVDEADVAKVAAIALTQAGHERQSYSLTGPAALTYEEVAAQLSEALHRQVKYVDVTPSQAKEGMLAAGLPEWMADFINDLRAAERAGLAARVSPDVERTTGRAATPYAETLRSVLAA